ncbi:MAG: glycosyltransferase [Bacteroidales bacterium]|nr:glycosyltransferase [Bacteroidales bacterium]
MLDFSIIVPVYNRPDEIDELLASLQKQTDKKFEVVVVEDGSTVKCDDIVKKYSDSLDISYYYKENEKPAIARNFGMKHARGNYFIFFDSDCIIPPSYFEVIRKELTDNYVDAFGGPDMAASDFNNTQKAISYTMTSFLTTGGIRGKGEKIDKFYPRSFNMGVSKKVFESMGGFPVIKMHPGEDMVYAIEIIKRGFKTRLITEAKVYHKRRTRLRDFYRQVFKFGKTRIIISNVYPETFKVFYLFPSAFIIGTLLLMLLTILNPFFLAPIAFYILLVFLHSWYCNNLVAGFLSVIAVFLQHAGYGMGVLRTVFEVYVLKKDEYGVLKNKFYPE